MTDEPENLNPEPETAVAVEGTADGGIPQPESAGDSAAGSDSNSSSREELPAATEAEVQGENAEEEPGDGKPAAASPAKPVKPEDWRDRRIAQLTARLKEFQEKKDEAPSGDPTADFDKRVEQEAIRRAEAREFASRCNAVVEKGRGQYGEAEFNSRLAQLRNVVDTTDPAAVAAYENFIRAGLETENLDRIIYDLAADPNEAVRVLALPPMKMAVELARRASAPEPEPVSVAPKPIKPVGGAPGRVHVAVDPSDPAASDRLSTAEWMKRREAQLAGGRR